MTQAPAQSPGPQRNALLAVVIGLGIAAAASAYQVIRYYGSGVNRWDVAFVVSVAAFLVLLLRIIGSLAATNVLGSRKARPRDSSDSRHEQDGPPDVE